MAVENLEKKLKQNRKELDRIWEAIQQLQNRQDEILGKLWEYKGKDY